MVRVVRYRFRRQLTGLADPGKRAFISYSRKDKAFAEALVDDLQGRGVNVWIDRRDIPPTGHIALAQSLDRRIIAVNRPGGVPDDPGVDLLQTADGRTLGRIPTGFSARTLAFSLDGRLLAVASSRGDFDLTTVVLIDVADRREVSRLEVSAEWPNTADPVLHRGYLARRAGVHPGREAAGLRRLGRPDHRVGRP